MFCCTFCLKKFPSRRNLNDHMLSHTKEKPHKCHTCAATFGIEHNLKNHIISVHDGVKEIKKRNTHCSLCSYNCYSKVYLAAHMRKHTAEQPFSCSFPKCGFKTKYETSVHQHVRHVHNAERPFECPSYGCTFKTKTKPYLERHMKRHSSLKTFTCKVPGCNYSSNLWGHLKGHKCTSEQKPWKCSICDFRSKKKNNLKQHENTHKKIKSFRCCAKNCDFATSLQKILDLHFDAKHKKKDVRCTKPGCNYKCGSTAVLKTHLRDHELPTLKCPGDNCSFRTRFKQSLLKHISRRQHEYLQSTSVVRPTKFDLKFTGSMDELDSLRCRFPDCGYQTKFQHHYDRHIATHNEDAKRNYVCKFCCSRFSYLCVLKNHVQRHTSEKPYRCSHCEYSAVSNADLRAHARRAHNIYLIPRVKEDELRKCGTCNESFWSENEFVLHSMSHLQAVVVLEKLNLRNE